MKRAMSVFATAALIAGMSPLAGAFDRGVPVISNDKIGLSIWGRGQWIGAGQYLPDPISDHMRIYEFLKEARMGFNGNYEDAFKYQIEFAYGGENQNTKQSNSGSYDLLDFVADVPVKMLGDNTIVKIGQFRVPFGREAIGDEGYTNFGDRSIAAMASNQGRDFGLAIMGKKDNFAGTLGTFPGGGRDIAQRYLPERFGFPELVARVGWDDGVDEDIYHVLGSDRDLKRTTKAVYLNALYTMDTRIGHSTSLLNHTVDNNLLVSTNYNPYLQRGEPRTANGAVTAICRGVSCVRGKLWQVSTDGVWRHPLSNGHAIEAEVEGNYGGYSNVYGALHIASARGQADYQIGNWTLAARYAILALDPKAGFLTTTAKVAGNPVSQNQLTGYGAPTTYEDRPDLGRPIHEITPSITYHFKGHHMKLVADLPIYINAPMYTDPTSGSYAGVDPTGVDQIQNVISAGNTNRRRTYAQGRMLFQFQF
jgi:hypothetical protein